ncbi:MAG: DUF402 domain-containing protein [Caldilineaceae bacterium]
MKRKTADRADWQRVTQRRFIMAPLDDARFTGHITLLCIDAVREPLWVESNGQRICIADAGHAWLHQIPHHAQHVVTTMFDTRGAIVQWYIDICAQTGVNAHGIPWFDDLYLDVIVSPDGKVGVYDADELDEALATDLITPAQYELAWAETHRITTAVQQGLFAPLELSALHYEQLLTRM